MKYDVVIVGGNVAGSMTAKTIAENSELRVAVITRSKEIGIPIQCAGGIYTRWLKECNLDVPDEVIASKVMGARMVSPNGNAFVIDGEELGMKEEIAYVLYRNLFDRWLADLAEDVGVDYYTKTLVSPPLDVKDGVLKSIGTNSGKIEGDVFVGADGGGSKFGKWCGINTNISKEDMHIAVQLTIQNKAYNRRYVSLFFGREFAPHGYAWVFPAGKGLIRVGVGVPLTYSKTSPGAFLDKFLKAHPELLGKVITRIGGRIPTSLPLESAVKGNVLLVGDAARHTDPFTGGGIHSALIGAMLAGETIANGEPLKNYDRKWKRAMLRRLRRRYRMKELVSRWTDNELDRFIAVMSTYKPESVLLDKEEHAILRHIFTKDPSLMGKLVFGFVFS